MSLTRHAAQIWRLHHHQKRYLTTVTAAMTARPARTTRLYFDDTYSSTCKATIVEAEAEAEERPFLILDCTVLHPQGGGQPADKGSISINGVSLTVVALEEDKENQRDGAIKHFVQLPEGSTLWSESQALPGQECTVHLDLEARSLYAKLHSAGHVLANVVDSLYAGDSDRLTAFKGNHFPGGQSFVVFRGPGVAAAAASKADFTARVQHALDAVVAEARPVHITPGDASSSSDGGLPTGRQIRVEGFEPSGCGGTHVNNTGQLGGLRVRSVKKQKDELKIGYDIDA